MWGVMPPSHVAFSYVVPQSDVRTFVTRFVEMLRDCPGPILDALILRGETAVEERVQMHRTLDAIAETDGEANSYVDNWHLQSAAVPPQYDPPDTDDPKYLEGRYLSIDIDDDEADR
jgi:hypothetical protein